MRESSVCLERPLGNLPTVQPHYDSQAGALHVLLDGTVVVSGAPVAQQAPVGVIDVSDLSTCYGKTWKTLAERVSLRLSMLTNEERKTLIDSLIFRQDARGPLVAKDLHGANAVFTSDQGWTYELTKPYSQYRTCGQSSLVHIEAFSGARQRRR